MQAWKARRRPGSSLADSWDRGGEPTPFLSLWTTSCARPTHRRRRASGGPAQDRRVRSTRARRSGERSWPSAVPRGRRNRPNTTGQPRSHRPPCTAVGPLAPRFLGRRPDERRPPRGSGHHKGTTARGGRRRRSPRRGSGPLAWGFELPACRNRTDDLFMTRPFGSRADARHRWCEPRSCTRLHRFAQGCSESYGGTTGGTELRGTFPFGGRGRRASAARRHAPAEPAP